MLKGGVSRISWLFEKKKEKRRRRSIDNRRTYSISIRVFRARLSNQLIGGTWDNTTTSRGTPKHHSTLGIPRVSSSSKWRMLVERIGNSVKRVAKSIAKKLPRTLFSLLLLREFSGKLRRKIPQPILRNYATAWRCEQTVIRCSWKCKKTTIETFIWNRKEWGKEPFKQSRLKRRMILRKRWKRSWKRIHSEDQSNNAHIFHMKGDGFEITLRKL